MSLIFQGPNQYVALDFMREVEISKICITFQGGIQDSLLSIKIVTEELIFVQAL